MAVNRDEKDFQTQVAAIIVQSNKAMTNQIVVQLNANQEAQQISADEIMARLAKMEHNSVIVAGGE